jgi:death on curing protein
MKVFLTVADVISIHADQVERYGGSTLLRDRGLLESAVSMPQATFGGQPLHNDVFEMAAAYLYHIVQNHPFADGNKRAGAAAALVFLDLNNVKMALTDDELFDHVIQVAQGQIEKSRVAVFLREHRVRDL